MRNHCEPSRCHFLFLILCRRSFPLFALLFVSQSQWRPMKPATVLKCNGLKRWMSKPANFLTRSHWCYTDTKGLSEFNADPVSCGHQTKERIAAWYLSKLRVVLPERKKMRGENPSVKTAIRNYKKETKLEVTIKREKAEATRQIEGREIGERGSESQRRHKIPSIGRAASPSPIRHFSQPVAINLPWLMKPLLAFGRMHVILTQPI